jgi:hypothetical protein
LSEEMLRREKVVGRARGKPGLFTLPTPGNDWTLARRASEGIRLPTLPIAPIFKGMSVVVHPSLARRASVNNPNQGTSLPKLSMGNENVERMPDPRAGLSPTGK